MGLENNNSGVYLSIADGKVVRRFKEPTPNSKSRVLTKGVNAGKEVHEEFYDAIKGWIRDIKIKTSTQQGMGSSWIVTIVDGDDQVFLLQMPYSSGYSSAFLKLLPNVDLTLEVRIAPKMQIGEGGKKKASMFINQGGKAIKWAYTKEFPNGLPQMRKLVVKNQEIWDDTDMMKFLEKMVETEILPQLSKGGTPKNLNADTQKDVDGLTEEELQHDDGPPPPGVADDLPF